MYIHICVCVCIYIYIYIYPLASSKLQDPDPFLQVESLRNLGARWTLCRPSWDARSHRTRRPGGQADKAAKAARAAKAAMQSSQASRLYVIRGRTQVYQALRGRTMGIRCGDIGRSWGMPTRAHGAGSPEARRSSQGRQPSQPPGRPGTARTPGPWIPARLKASCTYPQISPVSPHPPHAGIRTRACAPRCLASLGAETRGGGGNMLPR